MKIVKNCNTKILTEKNSISWFSPERILVELAKEVTADFAGMLTSIWAHIDLQCFGTTLGGLPTYVIWQKSYIKILKIDTYKST